MDRSKVNEILNKPLSQELMRSRIPARIGYVGLDGAPRVVPIGFLWNGSKFVIGTLPTSEKVKALELNPRVALTIDTESFPPHVLLVRGTASLELVEGVPDEYMEASRKAVPAEQFADFEAQVRGLYKKMVKIEIEPEWAKLIDFQETLPSSVEHLIKEQETAPA